jgi:hypothetical protein
MQCLITGIIYNHSTIELATSRHLLRDQLQQVACDQIGDESPFAQEPHAMVAHGWGQSLFFGSFLDEGCQSLYPRSGVAAG